MWYGLCPGSLAWHSRGLTQIWSMPPSALLQYAILPHPPCNGMTGDSSEKYRHKEQRRVTDIADRHVTTSHRQTRHMDQNILPCSSTNHHVSTSALKHPYSFYIFDSYRFFSIPLSLNLRIWKTSLKCYRIRSALIFQFEVDILL